MLSRFLRRTKTVEGDGFNSQPLARVVSVTETNWTSIPSDGSPSRPALYNRVNGRDNSDSTTYKFNQDSWPSG